MTTDAIDAPVPAWKKPNSTMFISSSTGKSGTPLLKLHDHGEHQIQHAEEQQRLHERPHVAEHRAEVGELVVGPRDHPGEVNEPPPAATESPRARAPPRSVMSRWSRDSLPWHACGIRPRSAVDPDQPVRSRRHTRRCRRRGPGRGGRRARPCLGRRRSRCSSGRPTAGSAISIENCRCARPARGLPAHSPFSRAPTENTRTPSSLVTHMAIARICDRRERLDRRRGAATARRSATVSTRSPSASVIQHVEQPDAVLRGAAASPRKSLRTVAEVLRQVGASHLARDRRSA